MTAPDRDAPADPAAGATTAVVLCGGASRRMGGQDKTALPFGASTVLDHLLDSLPPGWPVVCVGESRHTDRQVTWTRESPPGGGPVAGMTAGLAAVATPVVVLLAGDMPFAGPAAAHLAAALARFLSPPTDPPATTPTVAAHPDARRSELATTSGREELKAVVATDGEGRAQPLLGAYRTGALRAALPADPAGARLLGVLERLDVDLVPLEDPACLDVDTPDALARARTLLPAP